MNTATATRRSLTAARFSPRVALAGFAAALLVLLAGFVIERLRFGADDAAAARLVQRELVARFESSAARLGAIAAEAASAQDVILTAASDPLSARTLFERLDALLPADSRGTMGIAVYSESGVALAWAGRVSELTPAQLAQAGSLSVAPGGLGPRLLRLEPVPGLDRGTVTGRLGTVAVESLLGPFRVTADPGDSLIVPTSIAPVALSTRAGAAPSESPYAFALTADDGRLLVEAQIDPEDLAAARAEWRRQVRGAALWAVALALLLATAPLVDARRTPLVAIVIIALLVGARVAAWLALVTITGNRGWSSPANLLLTALLAAALTWLALDQVERWRLRRPRARLHRPDARTAVVTLVLYAAAGAAGGAVLWLYSRFLLGYVGRAPVDFLHVSLAPLEREHLSVLMGLLVLHAAVIWLAATFLRQAGVLWRRQRASSLALAAVGGWALGAGAIVAAAAVNGVPAGPLLVALAAVAACGAALERPRGPVRRASQAGRLTLLAAAIAVPALAMYPTLHAGAVTANEQLVSGQFGPETANLREDLQENLRRALEAIDQLPLTTLMPAASASAGPTADEAFRIWSRTDLARLRLRSAVELYAADARLVSRFALLPEYAQTPYEAATCEWDTYDEASPFGVNEPHVLRASRGICQNGRRLGTIVVRAMLDYRSLGFIAMENPYLESLRPDDVALEEGRGHDVELVVYGWSRAPLFTSGTSVWRLPDAVFERLVNAREPFWETLTLDRQPYRVYFLNDRGAIYAVGYPVLTTFGHLVNLAEVLTQAFLVCAVLAVGAGFFNALTLRRQTSGRALVREVRSSFYRKLFLAFVAVAVVPVIVLAIAIRAYFAEQSRAGVEEAARQTATVAQRLVEDYATLQQRSAEVPSGLDDQVMVLVGRAIDQVVNFFSRDRLQATSARDLFASGLVPTRTPADVYRVLAIDRLSSFVGEEEVGGLRYLLAAAPVRAGGLDGIVTVPQTLRRRESERQIAELDRRVLFASVLFVLLGAGLGYWMAERIADPVNRLTRATRRIARGDLDARVAATSSDELRRLVEDFNRMAADLKRQRTELERTQRLEAWADMARQVAHDIKNPLTPIQLSAEHARRINLDQGRPLSPALDACVDAILGQVALLRQISAEFSSFASSPTARPEHTDLLAVVSEVVEPYRVGLAGRVDIEVTAEPNLPSVRIDRTLFARALTNIVENALHAMTGRGRLTLAARRGITANGAQGVQVEINDTGVGMDAQDLNRIFEPYFSTRAAGTGLGLTIAKRNIELNGGTIAVSSERGRGTTVTLTLPVTGPVAA